jgi:SIR2-like domain
MSHGSEPIDMVRAIPRAAEWPEGADFARATLSSSLIEAHARRVLARALSTGRLVAFAGAGVSMAYGRMTWGQLLDALFEHLQHQVNQDADKAKLSHQRWNALRDSLWESGATDFHEHKGTYTITAQLFDEFWTGSPDTLKAKVAALVNNSWGRFVQVCKVVRGVDLEDDPLLADKAQPEDAKRMAERVAAQAKRDRWRTAFFKQWMLQLGRANSDASCYLDSLSQAAAKSTPRSSSDDLNLSDQDQQFIAAYAKTYASFLDDGASPVKTLVSDWGIRRILTTNYDLEIERALQALQFTYPSPGSLAYEADTGVDQPPVPPLHAAHLSTHTLDKEGTGLAMCFAVEGSRRHASVLHLHGHCTQPASLVVTEADYQRLYVDKHDKWDLVQNTVNAAFAANPLLFVGSNVDEDDILRPLRQFVTGSAHQRDRMAVAMLPASSKASRNRYNTLKLYLRFGIHTLHYGIVTVPSAQPPDTHVNWLGLANDLLDLCDKATRQITDGLEAGQLTPPIPLPILDDQLDPLDRGQLGSGQAWADLADLYKRLKQIQAHCNALIRQAVPLLQSNPAGLLDAQKDIDQRARALRLFGEELRTHITTFFFSKALRDLRTDVASIQSSELRLPRTRDRHLTPDPENTDEAQQKWRVYHRNRIASAQSSGQPVSELLAGVGQCAKFKRNRRQRTLLITGARGSGLGSVFDALGCDDTSWDLAQQMGGYCKSVMHPVLHMSLAFSDEVSSIVQYVVSTIAYCLPQDEAQAPQDLIERLAWSLDMLKKSSHHRCLVMIGNAGVLFDAAGRPKNGLVARIWQLLEMPEYQNAPIDFVLMCQEQQVPQKYRRTESELCAKAMTVEDDVPPGIRERKRRLLRLNIGLLPKQRASVIIYPIAEAKLQDVGRAVYHDQWDGFQSQWLDANVAPVPSGGLERLQRLLPHRFALTLVMAQARALHGHAAANLLDQVAHRVSAGSLDMAAERAIEAVLDGWCQLHLRGGSMPITPPPHFISQGKGSESGNLPPYVFRTQAWTVITEVLWHLSMFSRPVECEVLAECPAIHTALLALRRSHIDLTNVELLQTMLHRMESWCLIYRVEPRTYHPGVSAKRMCRYTVHRQMQKYHLRLSGGRNIESGHWDQFTTTLYASQPDEMPALPASTHNKLVKLIRQLSRYPDPRYSEALFKEGHELTSSDPATTRDWVDIWLYRLRAAYFLIRSNFSLGVIAHSADTAMQEPNHCGMMEEYRRLVRWITREALLWQGRADAVKPTNSEPAVFFPGELVWLLNESGVIALAQGKLEEADALLALAEQAARRIEADDSGSIHVRIRLHTALVQIERGRPSRAREILTPIAARVHGHEVPPLLANYYLGLIEHLGGNYRQAEQHYELAETGLRRVGRSRALALVLQARADLHDVMHVNQTASAEALAVEAIGLAQQGGHEDVRVIAMLTHIRLKIARQTPQHTELFAELTFAEQYAARMDMPRVACEVQVTVARLLLSQGETRMAAARAAAGLEIAALYDLKLMKARALLTLAQIYLLRRDLPGARHLVKLGKELAVSSDYYSCVRGFRDLELRLGEPSPS